ncbi:MAG: hypothetical protein RLZZ60_1536 [Bacteroidota bacterium]|jgi:small subunit ribosomal protein S20
MANHKSSIKRIRQTEVKNERNRYQHKTTRNLVRKLRETTDKSAAAALYVETASMLDKLAKRNVIHKNKASNLKSSLSVHVNSLK